MLGEGVVLGEGSMYIWTQSGPKGWARIPMPCKSLSPTIGSFSPAANSTLTCSCIDLCKQARGCVDLIDFDPEV